MPLRFQGMTAVLLAAWGMASCNTGARTAAAPLPEAEQVVRSTLKELYMNAGAAAPQSEAQQRIVLRMAEQASNGKELLLVMRAAVGVFPSGAQDAEERVRSIVTEKMMTAGTLSQLIDLATQYSVSASGSERFSQRILQLGAGTSDARDWRRIRTAAVHLKAGELEKQAQAKLDQLAAK